MDRPSSRPFSLPSRCLAINKPHGTRPQFFARLTTLHVIGRILRRHQARARRAKAYTQIITERGMPFIGCRHHLASAVALDFAYRVAGRARHVVTFVRNVPPTQLNRSRRRVNGTVSCRLVTVQNKMPLHDLYSLTDASQNSVHHPRLQSTSVVCSQTPQSAYPWKSLSSALSRDRCQ